MLFVRRFLRTALRPRASLRLSGLLPGVLRLMRALPLATSVTFLLVGRISRSGAVFYRLSVAVVAAVLECLVIVAAVAVTVRATAAAGGAVGSLVIVAAGVLALERSEPVEPLADCKRADALRGVWVSAAGDRCVTAVMRPQLVLMWPGVLHLGRLVSERCTRPIATMTTGTTCGEVTALCGTGRRLLWVLRQLALLRLVVVLRAQMTTRSWLWIQVMSGFRRRLLLRGLLSRPLLIRVCRRLLRLVLLEPAALAAVCRSCLLLSAASLLSRGTLGASLPRRR